MTTATLLRLIGSSRDTAVTLSRIAELGGCSRREVEQAVQAARLDGHPICTGSSGAYMAQSAQEAREQARSLKDRAIHQMVTAQALERAADAMDAAPLTLWGRAA